MRRYSGRRLIAAPASVRAHLNYAHALGARGDYHGAAQTLTRATGVAPRVPVLHLRLVDALRRTGRGVAELEHYQTAARLNPEIAEAWVGFGTTALSLSHDEAAEQALVRASTMLPGNPTVLNQLGVAYHKQGKFGDAQEAFRAAIQKNGRNPHLYFNLGVALAVDHKNRQAAVAFESALQIQPGFAPAHQSLAQVYEKLGDMDRAHTHRKVGDTVPSIYTGSG